VVVVVEETGEVMVEGTGEVVVEGLWVVAVEVWGQQDLDQARQDRGRVDGVQRALQAPLCPRPHGRLRVLWDPAPLWGFQVFGFLYRCLGVSHLLFQPCTTGFLLCARFI
jgi:hypothetical protein